MSVNVKLVAIHVTYSKKILRQLHEIVKNRYLVSVSCVDTVAAVACWDTYVSQKLAVHKSSKSLRVEAGRWHIGEVADHQHISGELSHLNTPLSRLITSLVDCLDAWLSFCLLTSQVNCSTFAHHARPLTTHVVIPQRGCSHGWCSHGWWYVCQADDEIIRSVACRCINISNALISVF